MGRRGCRGGCKQADGWHCHPLGRFQDCKSDTRSWCEALLIILKLSMKQRYFRSALPWSCRASPSPLCSHPVLERRCLAGLSTTAALLFLQASTKSSFLCPHLPSQRAERKKLLPPPQLPELPSILWYRSPETFKWPQSLQQKQQRWPNSPRAFQGCPLAVRPVRGSLTFIFSTLDVTEEKTESKPPKANRIFLQ